MERDTAGFCGYLAEPDKFTGHGIVVILGGESVMVPFLKLGKIMAEYFAKRGYIACSVSLFGTEGLPDSPDQIPVEHTVNAIDYLKRMKKCSRVSVLGTSMGSIAALAAVIHSGQADDLIMMSPSHVAFEGVSKDKKEMCGRSFLTWKGQDIPYVSPDFSKYKMHEAYEKAYADKERELAAMMALPITAVKARILFLAGAKDSSWPAVYSVEKLCEGLESSGEEHNFQKILYPDYGHMLPLKKDVMNRLFEWLEAR